jgi:hypothetical protein
LKFQVDVQAVRILLEDLAHSVHFLEVGVSKSTAGLSTAARQ